MPRREGVVHHMCCVTARPAWSFINKSANYFHKCFCAVRGRTQIRSRPTRTPANRLPKLRHPGLLDGDDWRHLTLSGLNVLVIGEWLGFAVGMYVVIGNLSSVVGTLVVPRRINSRISRAVDWVLDAGFLRLARRVRSFERRDRILAWQSLVSLLVRLAVWLGLLVAGFALLRRRAPRWPS
jgi:hypothetical protein